MKQPEQEKADFLMTIYNNDINGCIRLCDSVIRHKSTIKPQKDFYQRVKQILIDKQK